MTPAGSVVGVLHPGEMGAVVAGLLVQRGHRVLWTSSGRGTATQERAAAAGLVDVSSTEAMVERADVILSICPPHVAREVARSVAGFPGLFVDANAVSPATARDIAAIVDAQGGTCVDGGIVGSPPRAAGETRLYLSGPSADVVGELFGGTVLDARVLGAEVGWASALKMCYAAWTKGTAALLLAIRAVARAEDVEAALLDEWEMSQPNLVDRSLRAAGSAGAKGWRWINEMEQIAATFGSCELPSGFHQAAAEVFQRVPRNRSSAADEATLDEVLSTLLSFSAR